MLNPKDPNDIMSLEKSRNIVKEILDFGTSENEKMKIIELLCLELENTEIMKKIIAILKSSQIDEADKQKKLIL